MVGSVIVTVSQGDWDLGRLFYGTASCALAISSASLAVGTQPAFARAGVSAPVSAASAGGSPPSEAVALPPCTSGVIPALTKVRVALLQDVGSKISKTGDTIRFVLAEPINLPDCQAVAAGVAGVGEIIHAKKALGSGAAGELVAAARYLELGSRQLRLRSLQLTMAGGDNIKSNFFTTELGALGGILVPRDKRDPNVLVLSGTVVEAKTAEAFDLDGKAAVLSAPAPEPSAAP